MWSVTRNIFRRALAAFAFAALVAGLGVTAPGSAQAATLYISEFASPVGQVGSVQANVYPQPAITDQTVAITGASAQSAAFNAGTHAIQVECDADCSISIGTNPTATTTNYLMGDGIPYQFVVVPGQKIAVISNTSGGSGSDVNIVAVGGNAVTTSVPVNVVSGSSDIATISTSITRPGDTNAYAANDAFANSTSAPTTGGFTLTSACATSGGNGIITDAALSMSAGSTFSGELWIFDQAVTATNDNSALSVSDSDILNLVGVIPFNTNDVNAANTISWVNGLNIGYTCVGTANLRFLVKVVAAFTPGNAEVLSVRVKVQN